MGAVLLLIGLFPTAVCQAPPAERLYVNTTAERSLRQAASLLNAGETDDALRLVIACLSEERDGWILLPAEDHRRAGSVRLAALHLLQRLTPEQRSRWDRLAEEFAQSLEAKSDDTARFLQELARAVPFSRAAADAQLRRIRMALDAGRIHDALATARSSATTIQRRLSQAEFSALLKTLQRQRPVVSASSIQASHFPAPSPGWQWHEAYLPDADDLLGSITYQLGELRADQPSLRYPFGAQDVAEYEEVVLFRTPFRLVALDRLNGSLLWWLPVSDPGYQAAVRATESSSGTRDQLSAGTQYAHSRLASGMRLAGRRLVIVDQCVTCRLPVQREARPFRRPAAPRFSEAEGFGQPWVPAGTMVTVELSNAGRSARVAWTSGQRTRESYRVVYSPHPKDQDASGPRYAPPRIDLSQSPEKAPTTAAENSAFRELPPLENRGLGTTDDGLSSFCSLPATSGDSFFVLTARRESVRLTRLRTTDGKTEWTVPLGYAPEMRDWTSPVTGVSSASREVSGVVVIAGDHVLCGLPQGMVFCVSAADGTLEWVRQIQLPDPNGIGFKRGPVYGAAEVLAVSGTRVIIPGRLLTILRVSDGELILQESAEDLDPWDTLQRHEEVITADGDLVLLSDRGFAVRAFDLKAGLTKWRTRLKAEARRLAVVQPLVLGWAENGMPVAVRLRDGADVSRSVAQLWRKDNQRGIGNAIVGRDCVYAATPMSVTCWATTKSETHADLTAEVAGGADISPLQSLLLRGKTEIAVRGLLDRSLMMDGTEDVQAAIQLLLDAVVDAALDGAASRSDVPASELLLAARRLGEEMPAETAGAATADRRRLELLENLAKVVEEQQLPGKAELAGGTAGGLIGLKDGWFIHTPLLAAEAVRDGGRVARWLALNHREASAEWLGFAALLPREVRERRMRLARQSGDLFEAAMWEASLWKAGRAGSIDSGQRMLRAADLSDERFGSAQIIEARLSPSASDSAITTGPFRGLFERVPRAHTCMGTIREASEGSARLVFFRPDTGDLTDTVDIPFAGRSFTPSLPEAAAPLHLIHSNNATAAVNLIPEGQRELRWMVSVKESRAEGAERFEGAVQSSVVGPAWCGWLRGNQLTVVNAVDGRVLWRRELPGGESEPFRTLVAGHRIVATLSPARGTATVYSVATGRRLRMHQLDLDAERPHRTVGSRFVYTDSHSRLHCFDLESGEDLLPEDFYWQPPENSDAEVARLTQGRLGLLNQAGELLVIDTQRGRVDLRLPITALQVPESRIGFRRRCRIFECGRYLVVGVSTPGRFRDNPTLTGRFGGHALTDGFVSCIDLQAGRLLWERELSGALFMKVDGESNPFAVRVAAGREESDDFIPRLGFGVQRRSRSRNKQRIEILNLKTGRIVARRDNLPTSFLVRASWDAQRRLIELETTLGALEARFSVPELVNVH